LDHEGPVWRSCYQYAAVAARLKQLLEADGDRAQDEEIDALWRERAELAAGIVEAAAPTIEDVLLKVAMSSSLFHDGELRVVCTPQCVEECDRALAEDGDAEQCLKAREPELSGLRQRVEDLATAIHARWDSVERSEAAEGVSRGFSLVAAWDELNEAVWRLTRYEAMTAVGLRAKGTMFQTLLPFISAMDGPAALQDSYLRDFDRLAYRRLHGKNPPMPRRSVG
jgi:hypothetical protein